LPLSVNEILDVLSEYKITVLAGARGLSTRFVQTCVVIDVPDAHLWVHGGEFLITAGYLFSKNPLSLLPLIEGSALAGGAALGIKVGRFLGDLPKQVIDLADKLDFPLLDIPPQVNHGDLITQVLAAIVNQRFRILSQSSTIQDFFLEQVVRGNPLENILDGFESFTNCPIRLIQDGVDTPNNSKGMKEADIENELSTRIDSLTLAGRHVGRLQFLSGREPADELAKVALANAKTALMILIQQNLALRDAERKHSESLLQDLLFRRGLPGQDQIALAKMIGWAHEGLALSALIKIPERSLRNTKEVFNVQQICRSCAFKVMALIKNALYTELGGTAVFILPVFEEPDGTEKLFHLIDSIRTEVEKENNIPLIASLGSPKQNISKVSESYVEARETLDVVECTQKFKKIARWDDIDLERILVLIHGTDAGRKLGQKCLGPLILEDKKHDTKTSGLVKTLDIYADKNWSMKETAIELSIHYNTLKYRLKKIMSLINLDLQDRQSRVEISIALSLLNIDN